jgi:hypothetical protein
MDYTTYKIIHLVGVAAVAMGLGGMMAGGNTRKGFAILQGIGLLVMLVSGFGLLARLKLGFPHFAMVKVALWLVLGMLPIILRRLRAPAIAGICISLILVALLAWLGIAKPPLW